MRRLLNQRACTGHPYIIQLHEVFITDPYLAVVMEYAGGGDLATALNEHLMVHVSDTAAEHPSEAMSMWLRLQITSARSVCSATTSNSHCCMPSRAALSRKAMSGGCSGSSWWH